ncbi:Methyl-accepting chemotaxis protein [Paramagnetospirillum magnetotacticum MS-1]|uniref:Methyl-accepting chemotaxis protein n=1 Tax=Paramagnetospirillum magnetotacticum MS-1 TaxID=272627 RepID=A0A0C2YF57_PARME|nr:hemerythrin family protein [Paramagnetospirillum magnetotacticum]KIL98349.1 Methyl-accepting chemotaxis protein [Paramagnetospirillum magnetotacticum MS-1]
MSQADSHSEMDAEHRVQVGLISALERAVEARAPQAEIQALVEQLIDYTDVHFMSEQLLMRLAAYPDIHGHEAEHDGLMEQLRRIQSGFDLGDSDVVMAETQVLRNLLIEHIRTHDLVFAQYVSETTAPA